MSRHGSRTPARCTAAALIVLALTVSAFGQSAPVVGATGPAGTPSSSGGSSGLHIPDIRQLAPAATDAQGVSASLQVLVLLTVLTLVPSILVMMTAFPRVIIVLGLLRQAIGTPQLPPGQVLLGLSLFVTILIMAPTWQKVQAEAVTPYFENRIDQRVALETAGSRMKEFMYRQVEEAGNFDDIYMFLEYAENREIATGETVELAEVPMTVIIPAFMLSELKTAFIMGFRIYLPFLVIDMVIATILISMGMMMLPPVLISLPFKLLLFVLADGWHLVVETLLTSFVQ